MLGTATLFTLLWPVVSASKCKPEPPVTPPHPNNDACKLPAIDSVYLSAGFGYKGIDCVPSTGTLEGFMIFVDFPDAVATENDNPQSLYDFLVPETIKWYNQSSYNGLSLAIDADLSTVYRMPASAASYHWDRGLSYAEHEVYIQDALDAYTHNGKRSTPPESAVLYVVPVRGATAISRSITFQGRANTRQGVYVARKTVTVATDVFTSWGSAGFIALAHETGHTMCLPDYYPFTSGLNLGDYVGGWSAMGDVSGVGPDFFAWDKWRIGWVSDEAVDCIVEQGTSEHVLIPLETESTKDGVKAVVVASNQTSALVAEVRIAEGLDSKVCAPGVLLYTVDTSVETGHGPVRVIDANPGSRGCGSDASRDKNDGLLSLDSGAASSYEVPGWGIKVTVIDQSEEKYTIRVEYQGN